MKNAKKALSLLVAVLMIINVFAVTSFAADTAAVNLILTCDKANYKAGDTVEFTVSATFAADVGDILAGNATVVAYNNKVIAPMTDGDDIDAHGMVGLLPGYDSTMSYVDFTASGSPVDENVAEGWNSVMSYNYADDLTTTTTPSGTVALVKFKMKLASDVADGKYVVGFNEASYSDDYMAAIVNDAANQGLYGQNAAMYGLAEDVIYGFTNCTITVGEEAPAVIKAAKRGDAVKTLVGWGKYDVKKDTCDGLFVDDGNDKAAWNLAVEATFSATDIEENGLTFTNGKCDQIASLVATVKIGDGDPVTKSTNFIYGSDGKGDFSYYVVIEGIDNGADDNVTITFGGTLTEAAGGGAITGETVTFNLATEFAAAQGRGLPEAPTAE